MREAVNHIILPENSYYMENGERIHITHLYTEKKEREIEIIFLKYNEPIYRFATSDLVINVLLKNGFTYFDFSNKEKQLFELCNDRIFPKDVIERYIKSIII